MEAMYHRMRAVSAVTCLAYCGWDSFNAWFQQLRRPCESCLALKFRRPHIHPSSLKLETPGSQHRNHDRIIPSLAGLRSLRHLCSVKRVSAIFDFEFLQQPRHDVKNCVKHPSMRLFRWPKSVLFPPPYCCSTQSSILRHKASPHVSLT